MATLDEVRAAVEQVKAEITQDIAAGIVPDTVATFSELHDYTDANEYGGFTDPNQRASWSTDDLIDVHERVDEWLMDGRQQSEEGL